MSQPSATNIHIAYHLFFQSSGLIAGNEIRKKKPALAIACILGDWLIMGSCFIILHYYWNVFIYIFLIPVIGSRMMALGVLMHDASHYLLFQNKKANTWVGEIFLAWPIFQSLLKYRYEHFLHHEHLRTDKDTELPLEQYATFQFPLSRYKWYSILLMDITGINFFYYLFKKVFSKKKSTYFKHPPAKFPPYYTFYRTLYYVIVFSVIHMSGLWMEFLLFYIVPYITWFRLLFRLRGVSEHFHIPATAAFQTRTLKLSWLEEFLFYPHNLNYHTEHHLYPAIPFFNLKRWNKSLEKENSFKKNRHQTKGLRSLFHELTLSNS